MSSVYKIMENDKDSPGNHLDVCQGRPHTDQLLPTVVNQPIVTSLVEVLVGVVCARGPSEIEERDS